MSAEEPADIISENQNCRHHQQRYNNSDYHAHRKCTSSLFLTARSQMLRTYNLSARSQNAAERRRQIDNRRYKSVCRHAVGTEKSADNDTVDHNTQHGCNCRGDYTDNRIAKQLIDYFSVVFHSFISFIEYSSLFLKCSDRLCIHTRPDSWFF